MISGKFFFDPGEVIYADHFPGNPVVPGSVIIHAFHLAVHKHMGVDAGLMSVQGFRFRRFIAPGPYPYTLSRKEDVVACRLSDRGRTVVTGNFLL